MMTKFLLELSNYFKGGGGERLSVKQDSQTGPCERGAARIQLIRVEGSCWWGEGGKASTLHQTVMVVF